MAVLTGLLVGSLRITPLHHRTDYRRRDLARDLPLSLAYSAILDT